MNHALRGQESEDVAVSAATCSARRSSTDEVATTEDEWRDIRYSFATDRLRATGHTASDQVETVLYRIVASGAPGKIDWRRADGVVRPLLNRWRDETEAYCLAEGLDFRRDSSNPDTKRGLIRDEILPLLRRLHPAAEGNLLRLADRKTAPPSSSACSSRSTARRGSTLGGGRQIVREYDRAWLERSPVDLDSQVRWGPWRITAEEKGLKVRGWRPGDHLAGRRKKIQDVFVDAKVPRSEREAWPLVVRGDEVVAVPGSSKRRE